MAKSATKAVIWKKKSKATATVEYRANVCTAGIEDSEPKLNKWTQNPQGYIENRTYSKTKNLWSAGKQHTGSDFPQSFAYGLRHCFAIYSENRALVKQLKNSYVLTNLAFLWWAWTIIKILSTPTASTRNGITSSVSMVVVMPQYEQMPIAELTEASTITIPPTASTSFDSN